MIAIVDYDAGNTKSVINALLRLGVRPKLTSNPEELRSAERIIFPGVGHAKPAMEKLAEKKLIEVLQNLKQPFLGICLGMQLMCLHSEEGNTHCLGIFPEHVRRFTHSEKVPHMGWNVCLKLESELFKGIDTAEDFYFVHSYYAEVGEDAIASCNYGTPFAAALRRDNYYGVQFHPEKSGRIGSRLLQNFMNIT